MSLPGWGSQTQPVVVIATLSPVQLSRGRGPWPLISKQMETSAKPLIRKILKLRV